MAGNDCLDKVRFKMSDVNGELRFLSFEISQVATRCYFLEEIREYLLSRPLQEIDLTRLDNSGCTGDGNCVRAVKKAIAEYQSLFLDQTARKAPAAEPKRYQVESRPPRQEERTLR